jgi:diguanylate cyclase
MTDNLTFFPEYNASLEQNATYLRQILPLMSRYNIAIDPINFAVFYEYISGRNITLNNEIDALFTKQTVFTYQISISLFKKYICNTSINSLEKINNTLFQLINKTSEAIDNTGDKANAASIHFQNHSKNLENNHSLSEIKSVLGEIIAETQDLAKTSKLLQTQLDESALELKRLRHELVQAHETAKTDALTGLLNRGAFDKNLDSHIKNNMQSNSELCLVMLDLDHFKKVNDTYGHVVGDNVLRYTANLMKQHITEHHHAARYGGEEMAIIMPNTPIYEAIKIAEKIRTSLALHPLKRKGTKESIGIVTVSIGVSSLKSNDSTETLIERADKAMYRAKNNGRNQVMIESIA